MICKKIFDLHDVNDKPWIVYLRAVSGQYVEFFCGGERLLESNSKSIFFVHMCFEVDDVKEVPARITNARIKLLSETKIGKDYRGHCMAKDPDSDFIEFMVMNSETS